jgi:hypothetical protein
MAARKTVKTVNGTVSVDAEAMYVLTLAKAVSYLGQPMRPTDKNIKVTGEALIAIGATAAEGAIVDAAQVQ